MSKKPPQLCQRPHFVPQIRDKHSLLLFLHLGLQGEKKGDMILCEVCMYKKLSIYCLYMLIKKTQIKCTYFHILISCLFRDVCIYIHACNTYIHICSTLDIFYLHIYIIYKVMFSFRICLKHRCLKALNISRAVGIRVCSILRELWSWRSPGIPQASLQSVCRVLITTHLWRSEWKAM